MLFSIDFFAQRRGSCCPKKCVILIRDEALDRHWNDLLAARRNGREGFWFWVRTIYCVILPEVRRKGGNTEISRRLSVYRLPAIPQSVCRAVWIALLGTSDKSVKRNCHLPLCSFPEAHRNTGRAPVHALSQRKINCVCDFILEIAEADGLPNPRFTFSEPGEDGIQTVVDVKNIVHLHLTTPSKICSPGMNPTMIILCTLRRILWDSHLSGRSITRINDCVISSCPLVHEVSVRSARHGVNL